MSPTPQPDPSSAPFHTTRWSRVSLAKSDSPDGREALSELCTAYYEPVLAYLRRQLRDPDAARELSHAFFAELLAGGALAAADRERGLFRSYLLGALKHFLSHQREAAQRLKRGGGVVPVELDAPETLDVSDQSQPTPDEAFDRQWALTVLRRALDAVAAECHATGAASFFEQAKPWLTGEAARGDQSALAADFGMTPAAFKMAIYRLKQRFRQCVKAEIASTLADPGHVEGEMQALFAALSR